MHTRIIHVLGTGSGVGKSSLCLGLLAWLLRNGVPAKDLSYIKPMTQCVDRQPVAEFCENHGIACRDIGPVVFSKGFTRKFYTGQTGDRRSLMDDVVNAVKTIGSGKRFLIVDGVGHPAVGTAVGLSNATLAQALNSSVLLVAPCGIGAAIDNVTIALTFLKANGIANVDIVLNKALRSMTNEIDSYIKPIVQSLFRDAEIHGFILESASLMNSAVLNDVNGIAAWFGKNVAVERILYQKQTKL